MSEQDMFKAALSGDLSRVQTLVGAHPAWVDARAGDNSTALVLAARYGHLPVVKWLAAHGADVNAKDNDNETALIYAARNGHLPVVEWLAAHGADVNAKDNKNYTALMWAAVNGHLPVVKWLAAHGADVNAKDKDGYTALIFAAFNGHLPVVEWLAAHGADVNAKDSRGKTALDWAREKNHPDIVAFLSSPAAMQAARDKYFPPTADAFVKAAGDGSLTTVSQWLTAHPDWLNHNHTNDGRTALIAAARAGHLDVVKNLVQKKAAVDVQDNTGATALIAAARAGHLDVVKHLLQNKAAVDVQDNTGATALIAAARTGHFDVVKHLLECSKAAVDVQGNTGTTALIAAARAGHLDVVKHLLQNKAAVDVQDNTGVTALIAAARAAHVDVVKHLVDHGADVAIRDNTGATALIAAARAGRFDVAKMLFEASPSSADARDNDGKTAADYARTVSASGSDAASASDVVASLKARRKEIRRRRHHIHYASSRLQALRHPPSTAAVSPLASPAAAAAAAVTSASSTVDDRLAALTTACELVTDVQDAPMSGLVFDPSSCKLAPMLPTHDAPFRRVEEAAAALARANAALRLGNKTPAAAAAAGSDDGASTPAITPADRDSARRELVAAFDALDAHIKTRWGEFDLVQQYAEACRAFVSQLASVSVSLPGIAADPATVTDAEPGSVLQQSREAVSAFAEWHCKLSRARVDAQQRTDEAATAVHDLLRDSIPALLPPLAAEKSDALGEPVENALLKMHEAIDAEESRSAEQTLMAVVPDKQVLTALAAVQELFERAASDADAFVATIKGMLEPLVASEREWVDGPPSFDRLDELHEARLDALEEVGKVKATHDTAKQRLAAAKTEAARKTAQERVKKAEEELRKEKKAAADAGRAYEAELSRVARVCATHFPELLTAHEELAQHVRSDGLVIDSRSMANFTECEEIPSQSRHDVYKAVFDGAPCVLKEYKLKLGVGEQRRMIKEARLLNRLNHPNVAHIEALFFVSEKSAFIQLPFYSGGDLVVWTKAAARSDVQLWSVLQQALRGIEHIHQAGVIHGDIKPQNIVVDGDGTAKVIDFDISQSNEQRAVTVAVTALATHVGGTAGYMAPELLSLGAQASQAIDMYAFGATMYDVHFVLVAEERGEEPTPRPAVTPSDSSPPPMPECDNEALSELLETLLSRHPDDRLSASLALAHEYFTQSMVVDQERETTERNRRMQEEAAARAKLEVELAKVDEKRREQQAQQRRLEHEAQRHRDEQERARKELAEAKNATEAQRKQLHAKQEAAEKEAARVEEERRRVAKEAEESRRTLKQLKDKERRLDQQMTVVAPPLFWKTKQLTASGVVMVDVTKQLRDALQHMFNKSCHPDFIGTGRDSHGLTHKGFRVVNVERIENAQLWQRYAAHRRHVAASGALPTLTPAPECACDWHDAVLQRDASVNEVFLFHGSKSDNVNAIMQSGFDERYSGGGLFGAASYFADCSDKSDQYIPKTANNIVHFFVARVCLGNFKDLYDLPKWDKSLKEYWRPPMRSDGQGFHDSVRWLAPRVVPKYPDGRSRVMPVMGQRHCEFMLFDGRIQAYPELLVTVERVNTVNPK